MPKGQRNAVTQEEVDKIRNLSKAGYSTTVIMNNTGRARSTILRILKSQVTPVKPKYVPHCECCQYCIPKLRTKDGIWVEGCKCNVLHPDSCRKWRE